MSHYDVFVNDEFYRTYKRWGWMVRLLDKLCKQEGATCHIVYHEQLFVPWFGEDVMGNRIWEL